METLGCRIAVAAVLVLGGRGISQAAPPKAAAASPRPPATTELRIDAARSRFIVETQTSGLSASSLHDHRIEIADFSGTVTFVPGAMATGALSITVRSGSLHLLDDDKVGEGRTIEWTVREDVLEVTKYPEITFKTRSTKSSRRGDGTYDVRLTGDLALHGVRKVVKIPARVSLENGTLRAIGTFEIKQSDFDITPFSFVGGIVTIKDTIFLSFDIVANAV